jgi:hypothetical protein
MLHGKEEVSQGVLTTEVLGRSGCRVEQVLCADCVDGTECGQSRQVLATTLTIAFRAHDIRFTAPAFDLLAGLLYPNPHYRYMFHDVVQHPFCVHLCLYVSASVSVSVSVSAFRSVSFGW